MANTKKRSTSTPAPEAHKRTWRTPRVVSSEAFTKAALACCLDEFGEDVGSTGVNVACGS